MTRLLRLALLLVLVPGCVHYASVAVAPNGVVWVARNSSGLLFGPVTDGIYACVPQGLRLACTRMPARGME